MTLYCLTASCLSHKQHCRGFLISLLLLLLLHNSLFFALQGLNIKKNPDENLSTKFDQSKWIEVPRKMWDYSRSLLCSTFYQRTVAKIWLFSLWEPHLHPRVHSDGTGAQRDAKRARLYGVVVIRCHPAEAIRFSKQINVGEGIILHRGGKTSTVISSSS